VRAADEKSSIRDCKDNLEFRAKDLEELAILGKSRVTFPEGASHRRAGTKSGEAEKRQQKSA